MRLHAISDLHLAHRENRDALAEFVATRDYRDDWLIVAGDVGERPEHLTLALEQLTRIFAHVLWSPGNHELWCPRDAHDRTRGQARYEELVAICRAFGVSTPEDEYRTWPDDARTHLVPMFLLYDYSFHPGDVADADAVAWARASGVVCGDELMLPPDPWPSRAAWCRARCDWTQARLDALPADARTILINHWPLRYDLARPPRIPRFSIWCGTSRTEEWARRYRARSVISGHLHMRTTLVRHGVRYDEVSLGYPRDWRQEHGLAFYLREILPGDSDASRRFTPARDPFIMAPIHA